MESNKNENGLEIVKQSIDLDDELPAPEIGTKIKEPQVTIKEPVNVDNTIKSEQDVEDESELEDKYSTDDNKLEEKPVEIKSTENIFGIYTNVNADIINVKEKKFLAIPTIGFDSYYNYVANMSKMSEKTISDNILYGLGSLYNMESNGKSVSNLIFKDFKNTDKCSMTRDDTIVEPRHVNIIPKTKKSRVLNIVNNVIKGGRDVQLPLYNSGFQVTIKVPETPELYSIRKTLKDLSLEQEISTGGILFNSTRGDLINKILEFLFPYIVRSTLNVPKGEPIYKYIDPQDYPLLICGFTMALYPNGNTTTITCKNSTVFKDEIIKEGNEEKTFKKPVCDFVATATLSVKDTIKVREERITDFMFDVISRRKDNSVTIDDWEQYQKERLGHKPVDDFVTFKNGNDEVKFVFSTTSLERYIKINTIFSEYVKSQFDNIGVIDPNDREQTLNEIIELNKLTSYNSYVKEIRAGSDIINMYDNDDTIQKENLEMLSEILVTFNMDELSMNKYLTKLFDYLTYTTIAGVAVNNFSCPKCNELQVSENELIWLDPLNHFLGMLDYKFMSIVED